MTRMEVETPKNRTKKHSTIMTMTKKSKTTVVDHGPSVMLITTFQNKALNGKWSQRWVESKHFQELLSLGQTISVY